MSAVAHFGTGDSTTFTSASANTGTINAPANTQVGDLLVGIFYNQFSGGSIVSGLTGWTNIGGMGARSGGIYVYPIATTAALSSMPSSWTVAFSSGQGGRLCYLIYRVTGADLAASLDAIGTFVSPQGTSPVTIPAVTANFASSLLFALAYWNNSSTSVSTVTPDASMVDGQQLASPTTGNTSGIDIAYLQLSAAGSTGTKAYSTSPAGASDGGVLFAIKAATPAGLSGTGTLTATSTPTVPATAALSGTGNLSASAGAAPAYSDNATLSGVGALTCTVATLNINTAAALSGAGALAAAGAPGSGATAVLSGAGYLSPRTPVEVWESQVELDVAHFGGDVSPAPPGLVLNSYQWSDKWNSWMAFEAPTWQTSDGVWVVCHDQTTGSVFNANYDIPSNTWATLSTLTSTVGGYPIQRLQDVLAAFPNRVFFVENKGSQSISAWLNLLDTYGGYQRIVIKQYYNNTAVPAAAHARGYRTWGYYYDADVVNAPTTQQNWDYLGLEVAATGAHWATMLSYGKPVLAHVVASAAQRSTVAAYGANGYMASGVEQVIPQSPVSAGLSGRGSLVATATPVEATAAGLSGSGSLTATALPPAGVAALGGTGTLTSAAAVAIATTAALAGAGVLSATATWSVAAVAALFGAGVLTGSGATYQHYTISLGTPNSSPLNVISGAGSQLTVGFVPGPLSL